MQRGWQWVVSGSVNVQTESSEVKAMFGAVCVTRSGDVEFNEQ